MLFYRAETPNGVASVVRGPTVLVFLIVVRMIASDTQAVSDVYEGIVSTRKCQAPHFFLLRKCVSLMGSVVRL